LRAMIAAAKADGTIDGAERASFLDPLGRVALDEDEQAFIYDELARPVDLDRIAADVATPEEAARVYAAAVVSCKGDVDAERAFLAALARRLGIDDAMKQELDRAAA
jgi:uncharacterized membrane protein YebE (DUF533 family)